MKITVTQKDIDKGIANNSKKCPVARAIKRKTHKYVEVSQYYAWICNTYNALTYPIPAAITKFIIAF